VRVGCGSIVAHRKMEKKLFAIFITVRYLTVDQRQLS
jgi:hypothetical protein